MKATFATTDWNTVLKAGDPGSPLSTPALEALCRTYWYPVFAEIRRRGHGEADAQDLVQEFFACLLRRGSIGGARPDKGRFRSYLLGALGHFLADAHAHDQAAKRGGDREILSFEGLAAESRYDLEPASGETPDRAFDRRWVMALLESSLRQLEAEQAAAGKAEHFARLRPYLAMETEPGDYLRLAEELGIKTGAVAVAVHRLRARLRELVRLEVRRTLTDESQMQSELRHLFGSA